MPLFRIHRMKDNPRQQFRWAPHTSGICNCKPRDFELAGDVEALNFYDAWNILKASGRPVDVGDLLESPSGEIRICKYVGFEPAQWVLPEQKMVDAAPVA